MKYQKALGDPATKSGKQELSKEEKINNAPLIKMAEYEEPRYDYEYCNGYPNHT